MTDIKDRNPRLGDLVHYFQPDPAGGRSGICRAAVVVEIAADESKPTLAFFTPGQIQHQTDVRHSEWDGDHPPITDSWHWSHE